MGSISNLELRDLYEKQVRRNTTPDNSGATVDHGPTFVRWAAHNGLGWSEVVWSSLNEANADEAIAAHIEFYSSRGLSFMWGVYDYDLPHDLGTRLLNAGFVEAGVWIRPFGRTIYLTPAFTISPPELARLTTAIDQATLQIAR